MKKFYYLALVALVGIAFSSCSMIGGKDKEPSYQLSSLQDKHNEAVGDDYTKMVNILYLPFSALRVVDVASLTAAPQDLQNAYRAIGKDDAVITQNGNEWTITYSTKDYATDQPFKFKEVIRVDLNAPYLSVVTYRDDKISGFTEMKGIGNDQYLFSTEKERAVVTYVNGKVTAFTHAENVVDTDMNGDYTANSYLFTYDEGKILDLTAVPDGWLTAADKQDKLYRLYVLQDGVIRITGLKQNYSSNTYEPGYDVTLP